MPPNYRQDQPLTGHDRKAALAVGAVIVLLGAGLGIWDLTGSAANSGQTGRCVSLVIASSTGGGTIRHCGLGARTWCAGESSLDGPVARQAQAACRQAGLSGRASPQHGAGPSHPRRAGSSHPRRGTG